MNPAALPMVILPMTFVFVLLMVLVTKAPRVGAFVVGGLVLVAFVLFHRVFGAGSMPGPAALPMIVVPITFLFVLLLTVMAKSPRAGIGLVVALIVMGVAGFFVIMPALHRRTVYVPEAREYPLTQIRQQTETNDGVAIVGDPEAVYEGFRNPPHTPSAPSEPLSPIWSEGVEQEFEADVYPSSVAAARALGRPMADAIQTMAGDPGDAIKVVIFQEDNDRSPVSALGKAIERELPGVQCFIEADRRNVHPGEVGLTLRIDTSHQTVALVEGMSVVISSPQETTRIVATASTEDRRGSVEARFIDKPWVENFSAFASARPGSEFIVTRSNGTCTSEGEAHQQALEDAKARLTEALDRRMERGFAKLARPAVSTMDVQNGGFVADRFVQSFKTTTGKVWRQALLLDVSGPKLTQLSKVKILESHRIHETWARMGLSVAGVLALIGIIYFFLNMATRGYYEWSLRIAGVVLAVVAIVSILMIIH